MDESEYHKLRQRVKTALIKFTGSAIEYEDATQDIALKWHESGYRKGQTIDQAVIDYLRKSSGRKGTGSYEQRRLLANAYSIEESRDMGYELGVERSAGGDSGDIRIDFIKSLNEVEKLFYLKNLKIIGQELGFTESRMCQKRNEIFKKIERKWFLKKLGVDFEFK